MLFIERAASRKKSDAHVRGVRRRVSRKVGVERGGEPFVAERAAERRDGISCRDEVLGEREHQRRFSIRANAGKQEHERRSSAGEPEAERELRLPAAGG